MPCSSVGQGSDDILRAVAGTAFVLGGTGMIGRAAVRRLAEHGWDVTVGARNPSPVVEPHARFHRLDRKEGLELPGEVDALVDVFPMTAADGRELLGLAGKVGTIVAISTASVYADGLGRTLDEADELGFPEYPIPVPETCPLVEAADTTYSHQKAAMELTLLEQDAVPATTLRPCAIHGPGAKLPRELFFVKRALDGRELVVLAHHGENVFHTTSVDNLAELIRLACEQPGTRALNAGDPEPPPPLEIGRTIGRIMDWSPRELLVPDGEPGGNPWGVPLPLVVDMAAAQRELGYRPVTTYADAVRETVRWLVEERVEPAGYLADLFDYEAEDAYAREHA